MEKLLEQWEMVDLKFNVLMVKLGWVVIAGNMRKRVWVNKDDNMYYLVVGNLLQMMINVV